MSEPSEAKGGKSSKMPILMVPALVMESSASAAAAPAPIAATPSERPRAKVHFSADRREVEICMLAPWLWFDCFGGLGKSPSRDGDFLPAPKFGRKFQPGIPADAKDL